MPGIKSGRKTSISDKGRLSRQAIPFRENSQPASWMLKLDKKRLEQCASGFYAIAMEMSKEKRVD